MAKTTESNLNTIKAAIIYAHDELGNSRAIGKHEIEACNISEQAINQWADYVEELRIASNNYLDLAHDAEADAQKIQTAQGRVWSEWRRVLKQGTEKDFDSRFFIRKDDIVHICGLCGEKFLKTAKGKNLAHATKADFRRAIETLIGIRLTGNGMLSDEDRDTISTYEKAVAAIKQANEALNGTKDAKGQPIPGLNANLSAAKASLKEHEELAVALELDEEKTEKFLQSFKDAVEKVETAIKETKKKLEKASNTKAETQETYNKVILTLRIAGAEA